MKLNIELIKDRMAELGLNNYKLDRMTREDKEKYPRVVTQSYMSKILNGKPCTPSSDFVKSLSIALEMNTWKDLLLD